MNLLDYEIIDSKTPETVIIWLHGLGADGYDFIPIAKELKFSDKDKIKFIFPHAPIIPVTINNNMKMRAWYDIYNIDIDRKIDDDGINDSVEQIKSLFDKLKKDHPNSKYILAGFSQGGVIALNFLLKYANQINGILALSCYLSSERISSKAFEYPVFMAHGEYDNVIPIELAIKSKDLLQKLKMKVLWKTYPMAHQVCEDEIEDISKYLETVING